MSPHVVDFTALAAALALLGVLYFVAIHLACETAHRFADWLDGHDKKGRA